MSNPILATKLLVPPPRPGLVPRPHLLARLNAGLDRDLTLLSAPAGSGKSTLLSEWLARPGAAIAPTTGQAPLVGWISLDARDSDLASFLSYLVAALRPEPELRALLPSTAGVSSQPPGAEAFLTLLINGLAEQPGKRVLVLDDYHTIDSHAVHNALAFLLERKPASLHIVVATRIDPPLLLARLRAQDQISELRAADFQFTSSEAGDLLRRLMGVPLSEAQAASLNERVEGWAVGLQLAGLSLRDRDPGMRERFIAGFSGRQHFVFDYLADEVLGRQPADVQSFLLRTAVPERLCAPLVDALLTDDGVGDEGAARRPSQEMLEELEHRNLFLAPLDDAQQWYRYHHLFRELLLARLVGAAPHLAKELHGRASRWFAQNGFLPEAMEHALAAGDHEYVADTIEQWWRRPSGWIDINYSSFLRWIAALPQQVVQPRWMLRLLTTRTMYVRGDTHAALDALDALEAELRSSSEAPAARQILESIPGDRASYALMQGDLRAAIDCGRGMLPVLAAENHIGRARALSLVAMAELRAGDVVPADADFGEAAREAGYSAVPTLEVPFLCSQAESRLLQGKLQEAYDLNEQALELCQAGDHELPLAGFAHVGLAKVLYERNNLAAAAARARTGIQLLGQGGIAEAFGNGHGVLALIRQAMGDATGALGDAEQGVRLAMASGLPRNISEAGAYRARVWLAQGQIAPAVSWVEELPHLHRGENLAEFEDLTAARVFLAQREARQALAHLERLEAAALQAGRAARGLEAEVLRSLAVSACGDRSAALALLEEALEAAEPQGYVRVFLDAGPGILPLLEQLVSTRNHAAYACRVLAALTGSPEPPGLDRPRSLPPRPLTMPSEREMQVLKLLATELSVPEIAEQLVVAPSTVRSHVKHLYEILDAHSRFEAVGRARELDLI